MKEYFDNIKTDGYHKALDEITESLMNEQKKFVITANPETIMLAESDKQISKMLKAQENLVLPDGIGVVKAAKILGINIKERVPGVEIAYDLIKICEKENKSIYFFGSSEETLHNLEKALKKDFPKLNVVGMTNGYVEDKTKIFKKISKLKPDVVLVAMGIPYQEKLIDDNLHLFEKGIFVGVGGSLDVISGSKKRAPQIFIKLNLEWLYRLIKEPKRIKRFYKSNIKFLFKIRNHK